MSLIQATAADSSVSKLQMIYQQTVDVLLWRREAEVITDLAHPLQGPDAADVRGIFTDLPTPLGLLAPDRDLHVRGDFMREREAAR